MYYKKQTGRVTILKKKEIKLTEVYSYTRRSNSDGGKECGLTGIKWKDWVIGNSNTETTFVRIFPVLYVNKSPINVTEG